MKYLKIVRTSFLTLLRPMLLSLIIDDAAKAFGNLIIKLLSWVPYTTKGT